MELIFPQLSEISQARFVRVSQESCARTISLVVIIEISSAQLSINWSSGKVSVHDKIKGSTRSTAVGLPKSKKAASIVRFLSPATRVIGAVVPVVSSISLSNSGSVP